MTIDPSVLAAFTCGRRLHEGLMPARLDALLGVPRGSTRAIEQRREVRPETRAAFERFNFPENID